MNMKTKRQRHKAIVTATEKNLNACVIELAESFLNDFPESQAVWTLYGLALCRVDRFKDAKKALLRSISLVDDTDKQERISWLYCRMGRIYEDSGNFRKAIAWFEKAHETNPNEATFLIYIGVKLLRLEKYEEAVEVLTKATTCHEGCIDEAFYNLGVVNLIQRNYAEAKSCFEKALELDPKYKEAREQLKDINKVLEITSQE